MVLFLNPIIDAVTGPAKKVFKVSSDIQQMRLDVAEREASIQEKLLEQQAATAEALRAQQVAELEREKVRASLSEEEAVTSTSRLGDDFLLFARQNVLPLAVLAVGLVLVIMWLRK